MQKPYTYKLEADSKCILNCRYFFYRQQVVTVQMSEAKTLRPELAAILSLQIFCSAGIWRTIDTQIAYALPQNTVVKLLGNLLAAIVGESELCCTSSEACAVLLQSRA